MKGKVFLLVAVALISIMVGSCYQENKEELNSINSDNEFLVSAQTAEDVAFFYLHKNKNMPETRSRQANDSKIKNSFSINDSHSDPVMHVINYEGGGFAIISGDNRIEPMLAYADEGSFSDNELDYPDGLTLWINHIKSIIGYIRDNNVTAPEEIINHWKACEMYGKSRVVPDESLDCVVGEKVDDTVVGPLLSTKWDQVSPYNITMPRISCNGENKYAYVGCVFVALGQMMKYWEYPSNFNWASMPDTTASMSICYLFNDIQTAYEKYDTIEYYCDRTSAHDTYLPTLLMNDFGYQSATLAAYDYFTVKNEVLFQQRPVLLRGVSSEGAHMWVCDGAHQWSVCNENSDGSLGANVYLHLHMNWGWGGDNDGWYSSGNFYIPAKGETYDSDLIMIYNIVPN